MAKSGATQRRLPQPPRLARRIVLSVALGLALILVLFGLVAMWTVEQATESEYAARLEVTRALAAETDVNVQAAQNALRRTAPSLAAWKGGAVGGVEQAALRAMLAPNGAFSSVELLDRGGTVRWSGTATPVAALPAWGRLPVAATALIQGQAAAGACPDDEDPGSTALCLATPVRGAAANGAMIAELDPRDGSLPLVPATSSEPEAEVQIVDAGGRVIAAEPPEDASMAAEHVTLLAPLLARHTAGVRLHQPGTGDAFPAHLIAYAPLLRVPGWGVVVELPQDTVLAAPRQLARRLILFGAGSVLLAAAVAWGDVLRVVRPLRVLTAAAERFSLGLLDTPVSLRRSDELGTLAAAFETMRLRLRASLDEIERGRRDLERRVAERTAQVEEQNRHLAALNAEAARLNAALRRQTDERAALLGQVLGAQEGERERIARDLHDGVGQSLTAVLLSLEVLDEQLPDGGDVRARLAASRDMAAATLAELRALIAGLRPALLDDLGLVPALRASAAQRLEEQGVRVEFCADLPGRLPPPVENTLFRIVQEALANVAKHAHARAVRVDLRLVDERVLATISDDGDGFDAERARADLARGEHVGLLGMRERAALLGGSLAIESAPGRGAVVRVDVPLAAVGEDG